MYENYLASMSPMLTWPMKSLLLNLIPLCSMNRKLSKKRHRQPTLLGRQAGAVSQNYQIPFNAFGKSGACAFFDINDELYRFAGRMPARLPTIFRAVISRSRASREEPHQSAVFRRCVRPAACRAGCPSDRFRSARSPVRWHCAGSVPVRAGRPAGWRRAVGRRPAG